MDELTEEEQSLIRNLRITHEEFEEGADASLLAVAKERNLVLITDDKYTSGEKLPPYLRLPEKAIAYSVAIKVGK